MSMVRKRHRGGARKGLYYDLLDRQKLRIRHGPNSKFVINFFDEKIDDGVEDLTYLTQEQLLSILEDDVARPKKTNSEVVETEVLDDSVETVEATEKRVAHDVRFDKATGKWMHIKVEYDAPTSVEVLGANQAVAMKKLHDMFTTMMIKKEKKK